MSGSENFSGLNDLNRHDNITGLNDLNSLFGLKKSKAACTLITGWFPCHQEPQQPQWPQQPQQPQWPQWPLQPHFIKKITELDFSINPGTKTTYSALIMWVGSSKSQYFLDFRHPFFWRLWRTGLLLLTKSKGHTSNAPYSEFPNHFQIKSNLHISICQNQIHYSNS